MDRESLNLRRTEQMNIALTMIEAAENSPYTRFHSIRVGRLSKMVAIELGWPEDQIDLLKRSAISHDIGKVSTDKYILFKEDPLTNAERRVIEQHPRIGENILRSLGMSMEGHIVGQHHELMDGSGYPEGLKGRSIIKHARIIGACDVLDALMSHRPYRQPLTFNEAQAILYSGGRTRYDQEIVAILSGLYQDGMLMSLYERDSLLNPKL